MNAQTLIEKIMSAHSGRTLKPGEIADVFIDARAARDFGGANVVKNLLDHGLEVADPARTVFTFDCNPTGSDQLYAANQQKCRTFARERGLRVFDIDSGIGTHVAIDGGLAWPGSTLVSTDSHANILGAIGAFGQGMGDQDIAAAWSYGKVWFKVPATVRVELVGTPSDSAGPARSPSPPVFPSSPFLSLPLPSRPFPAFRFRCPPLPAPSSPFHCRILPSLPPLRSRRRDIV